MKTVELQKFESAEQEAACVLAAKQGDERAKTRLVSAFLPYIRMAAAKYAIPGVDFEDLVQDGVVAMYVNAVPGFDPSAGRFITYLKQWLRDAFTTYLKQTSWVIRVPMNQIRDFDARKKQARKNGEAFTEKTPYVTPDSFDAPVGDHHSLTFADVIASPSDETHDDSVATILSVIPADSRELLAKWGELKSIAAVAESLGVRKHVAGLALEEALSDARRAAKMLGVTRG